MKTSTATKSSCISGSHRPPPFAPTVRRSIMSINSALRVSAAFIAAVVCFDVLEFEPKTTTPPIMAAIAPIVVAGSNLIAPSKLANIQIPPAAMATLENSMVFRHPSKVLASSSIRLRYAQFDRADHHQPCAYLIAFAAPRTVPNQLVLITSSLSSLSSGTNPLPPHVGHLCSLSVPFSITPSPLQSGHVFCAMWTPPKA